MIQQNVHEKYIVDTSNIFVNVSSHDYRHAWHTVQKVPPGQPDHLSARGPLSHHNVGLRPDRSKLRFPTSFGIRILLPVKNRRRDIYL